MVKVSETIICQRFVQNAWKKDLCSNCFKSKEDHRLIPEKKITYRWTSHVNNFPQHGILKGRQKNEAAKTRNVSFHAEETEIIGFGGEEVSSDDEYYPTMSEGPATVEMDTEEDKAFRKLTQSNTDFNSVPANLKSDQQEAGVKKKESKEICGMYSNLELGKPLIDADGCRQTLHVSVEPFRNSTIGTLKKDGVTRSNKTNQEADLTIEKTDSITNCANSMNNNDCNKNNSRSSSSSSSSSSKSTNNENSGNSNCDVKQNSICILPNNTPGDTCVSACNSSDKENFTGMLNVEVTETINEANVFVKGNAESKTETKDVREKYSTISNVPVHSIANVDARKTRENDVTENMKNAKTILEPIFRLNCKREDKPKLSIYQSSIDSKEKRCSMNKDCNPINLPLIMSKELEIELDKPGSRELVGEPDGKADSDDAHDPLKTEETKSVVPPSDSGLHINPQRSFLHATKPKPASKPVSLECTPTKTLSNDSIEHTSTTSVPQTPKMQALVPSSQNTGSTKRQAPKPPSPKSAPPTPILAKTVRNSMLSTADDLTTSQLPVKPFESSLVDGTRDTVNGDSGSSSIRRRLHLEPLSRKNRNSVCVSMTPSGTAGSKQNFIHGVDDTNTDGGDAASISSSEYIYYEPVNPVKCSRSLSCDSISPTNGLPEKTSTSKYVGTTIKMKSTLKKFLRLNSKDDEKSESENTVPVTPRRRIEIIHPLDLNKSSIEILRPQSVTEPSSSAKKAPESNLAISSTVPETNYVASSTVRPNKPPPPPRNQSLEQKHSSEMQKPARPPPPKSVMYKSLTSKPVLCHSSSNTYENLGESRQNIAPAKPQRASSMRDRARQIPLLKSPDGNAPTSELDSEVVPECDRLQLQQYVRQLSDTCDMPTSSSSMACFDSETESDHCYQSIMPKTLASSTNNETPKEKLPDTEARKMSVVNNSIEDNYNAIVIANHETLSSFLDQVNQAVLTPRMMKVLQATPPIRFEHFSVVEHSRVSIFGWHFYNATLAGQEVVISVSNKQIGPAKSLPLWITLYPLLKFTEIVPSRFIKEDVAGGETNAYVTVWNEERIESVSSYCKRYEHSTQFNENALLFMQLMNALKLLQAGGIEDISLDEIFICKREPDVESKLVLPPMTVECNTSTEQNDSKRRMSLCSCASSVLSTLMPKKCTADIVKNILSDEKAASLSQAKSVAEYWLWGPHNVTLTNDRQNSLQRWLDLERATQLHKLICKRPEELTLGERCHMIFLVRTNAKSLTEASFLLEKSV